ncbi:MAG: histidinol dehydrogenase [Actinomycetota bacterium]
MTINIDWLDLTSAVPSQIEATTRRSALPDRNLRLTAATIVANIAERGDAALDEYAARFGGSLADASILVSENALTSGLNSLETDLGDALDAAIWNVRSCHRPQVPRASTTIQGTGTTVERVWTPIERVGVYVPGGRATYPSSLIMGVVPALVAGVREICVATPARPDGTVDPVVLGTAAKLGVTEVYAMGGAQAIGALAYGTDTVKRVDKIVGPGGPWVTAAKLAVYGDCGVDLPAGPSEAAIVADASANPAITAADVMCQAEHGEESSVILITASPEIAEAVVGEIERQLPGLERSDIITKALENHGRIVITESTAAALEYANRWAPEHLSVHTENSRSDAGVVPNAGSVFVGEWTPEAAGDYATGANHVLPTGGLARAYGPLSVDDFGSWRQIQTMTYEGLESLADTITILAEAEGLTAHANSVTVRLSEGREKGISQ